MCLRLELLHQLSCWAAEYYLNRLHDSNTKKNLIRYFSKINNNNNHNHNNNNNNNHNNSNNNNKIPCVIALVCAKSNKANEVIGLLQYLPET